MSHRFLAASAISCSRLYSVLSVPPWLFDRLSRLSILWERIPAWREYLSWLLNVVYLALLAVFSPLIVWQAVRTGKYRDGYREKLLGLVPRRDGDATCVWIHAVSVGEVNLLADAAARAVARSTPTGNSSSRRPAAPATSWPAKNTPTSPCSTARSISVGPCELPCAACGRRCWCWPSWSFGRT